MRFSELRSIICGAIVTRWLTIFVAVLVVQAGCASKPKSPPKPPAVKVFRLTHHMGGTHYRAIADGNYCYQTFDRNLLVMAVGEDTPVKTIELGAAGETGPAIDMILHATSHGKRLWIVIEGDELLELALEQPQSPEVVNRLSAARLGIRPRRLSIVDDELYVSGPGGVVRVRDGQRVFKIDEDVSRVARTEHGLVACIGRQAIRLDDARFVGSATDFPTSTPVHLVFVRQGAEGGLVGLMIPDLREVDTQRTTVAVPGEINSVRIFDDRLWIASDRMVVGYRIASEGLVDPTYIDVLGSRDVSFVNDEHIAICGTFGRAIYRVTEGPSGQSPGFVKIHREPSRLTMAVSDGRYILAGGVEGLWTYLINSRVDLTQRQFENAPPPPQTNATVPGGSATISDDRRTITITSNAIDPGTGARLSTTLSYADIAFDSKSSSAGLPAPGGQIHCVEAVDGDFWVGHDRGITVIKAPPEVGEVASAKKSATSEREAAANQILGRIRLAGPVQYIYPLLVGGGASFVSEFGGFGVAKFVDEPIAQSTGIR